MVILAAHRPGGSPRSRAHGRPVRTRSTPMVESRVSREATRISSGAGSRRHRRVGRRQTRPLWPDDCGQAGGAAAVDGRRRRSRSTRRGVPPTGPTWQRPRSTPDHGGDFRCQLQPLPRWSKMLHSLPSTRTGYRRLIGAHKLLAAAVARYNADSVLLCATGWGPRGRCRRSYSPTPRACGSLPPGPQWRPSRPPAAESAGRLAPRARYPELSPPG